jgi:hypothetical protein
MSEHRYEMAPAGAVVPMAGPGLNNAAQAFGQGAMMGATVGAMMGAARAFESGGGLRPQAPALTRAALMEASRLGVAAGMGAAAASLVPANGALRTLTMVAVGAAVLSATDARTRDADPA